MGSLAACGQSQSGRCRTTLKGSEVCTGGIIADAVVAAISGHLPVVGGFGGKLIQGENTIDQIAFCHINCSPILSSIHSILQFPVGLLAYARSPAQGNRIGRFFANSKSGDNIAIRDEFHGNVVNIPVIIGCTVKLT